MDQYIDSQYNQDKVLKESLSIFKGKSLDFLDIDLSGEITEVLGVEITETITKKAYADNALKLSNNTGVHHEWEAEINKADIKRFASYHIDLSRIHNMDFTTVIITTKNPSITTYKSPSMTFTPKIINLKERDADKVLEEIEAKLKREESGESGESGEDESINELLLIYLPLHGSSSGKTTADLLDTAIKLTPRVTKGDEEKKAKIHSLMILLSSTFVTDDELNKILEENSMYLENNRAVRVLEERGMRKGFSQGMAQGMLRLEQTAKNMLRGGLSLQQILEYTGLEYKRLLELQAELDINHPAVS